MKLDLDGLFPTRIVVGTMILTVDRQYVANPHLYSEADFVGKRVELWVWNGTGWKGVGNDEELTKE